MIKDKLATKLNADEVVLTGQLLKPALEGTDRQVPELQIKSEMLDRSKADKEALAETANEEFSSAGLGSIAAFHCTCQEAQRIRRDIKISTAGHKRLLASCLDMMYRRANQLVVAVKSDAQIQ